MRRGRVEGLVVLVLALATLVVSPALADTAPTEETNDPPAPAVSDGGGAQAGAQGQPCDHPYPCGYRWSGPAGPYELHPMERGTVTSFDGVEIKGFIVRPVVPDGVQVPVILTATPYLPAGYSPPSIYVGGVPGEEFVAAGYAVAAFSVRGTGDSGGCFGLKSEEEAKDLPLVVDWLANQPWSNGRVGMQGLSYPGTTPVMTAVQNPPALKTIVIAGTILDEYTWFHSPQGAAFIPIVMTVAGPAPGVTARYSLRPGASPDSIGTTRERVCEDVVTANTVFPVGEVRGYRNPEFWTERRFIDRVPGITAATFVVHGFQDRYGSGHAFQDDWAWQTLASAPKRMLVGQWGHEWPNSNGFYPDYVVEDWSQRLLVWFDYWLKGWGDTAPGLGEVEYQDNQGDWQLTDAWPPPARDEVVYLTEGKIQPVAGEENATFLSVIPPPNGGSNPDLTGLVPAPDGNEWRWPSPCPDPTRLVYVSDPVEQRTVLAGNPFAWLDVESSAPAGLFELQLYDLGLEFSCDDRSQVVPDVRPLTEGSADLRYHESEDYQAHPVAPDTPAQVRVDIASLAEVLEPGHRLAVVVSHGFWQGTTPELFPFLTLHGDGGPESSHLVLPVVTGGFGGQEPTLDYPPTPFIPSPPPSTTPSPAESAPDAPPPGASASPSPGASGDGVDRADEVVRVAGQDRIETALELSQRAFPTADQAVLARADDFPDALASGTLGAEIDGPVLLTSPDGLDPRVAAELDRLGVSSVYLAGGTTALSPQVQRDVVLGGMTFTRLDGENRFHTAAAVAREVAHLGGPVSQAIVARADSYADALAAGNLATTGRAPILLTTSTDLPAVTAEVLDEVVDGVRVFVAGGPEAVGAGPERQLTAGGFSVERLAGGDRYATAVAVVREAVAQGADVEPTILASGRNWPDALAAIPAADRLGGIVLLVDPADMAASPATRDFLSGQAEPIDTVLIAGGTEAIARLVQTQALDLIRDR